MQDLKQQIEIKKQELIDSLNRAQTEKELNDIRLKYLSRSGEISELMHVLKNLSSEDKAVFGPILNNLKKFAEQLYEDKKTRLIKS